MLTVSPWMKPAKSTGDYQDTGQPTDGPLCTATDFSFPQTTHLPAYTCPPGVQAVGAAHS